MDANANTKPSVKKVREWPKFDFLSFLIRGRELVANVLKNAKKTLIPNIDGVGDSLIKKDYSRFNINSLDDSEKVEKFPEPNEITSKSVRKNIDEKFIKKYSKKNEKQIY